MLTAQEIAEELKCRVYSVKDFADCVHYGYILPSAKAMYHNGECLCEDVIFEDSSAWSDILKKGAKYAYVAVM